MQPSWVNKVNSDKLNQRPNEAASLPVLHWWFWQQVRGRGQWGLGGLFQNVSCRKWGLEKGKRMGISVPVENVTRATRGENMEPSMYRVAWLEVWMHDGVRNSVSDFSRIRSWLWYCACVWIYACMFCLCWCKIVAKTWFQSEKCFETIKITYVITHKMLQPCLCFYLFFPLSSLW